MDVRRNERLDTRPGSDGSLPATWLSLGARIRAAALLAATVHLARCAGCDATELLRVADAARRGGLE